MALPMALLAGFACSQGAVAQSQPANPPAPAQTSTPTPAASSNDVLETVVVFARGEQRIGISAQASDGAVGGTDLTIRPTLRVADILEVVPGLIAAQHSGSGKAQQYFLRGINLDHGTDFTNYFDDVPMNFRTHGHGQGYLDLNGMIPETVTRIDYRKGPYRADVGDMALAGAAYMTTVDGYEHPFATAEYGDYGYKRLVTGGTVEELGGKQTAVVQWKTYNGPWQLPEDLQHISFYGKDSRSVSLGTLDTSFSFYNGKWQPTEQIPDRTIGHTFTDATHNIDCKDAFCAIDPTARGKTTRAILSARLTGESWRVNTYGQYYDWHMLSNPTYYLDDPVNGDQIDQKDHRWTFGGRGETYLDVISDVALTAGAEWRYDDIPNVGVDHTVRGHLIAPIALNSVKEGSVSPYVEANWNPYKGLRLMAGLRGDFYSFDVKAKNAAAAAGNQTASIASPKLGVSYAPADWVELYANWGQGFHSNDGRGVVNAVTPVPGLVKGEGKEGGARFQYQGFTATVAYWWLDLNSELKFVGDSNSVEPSGKSARNGLELTMFWRPVDWLAIDGVYTKTNAKYLNAPGADHIAEALENVTELGISGIWPEYEASIRLRHIGPYPLTEDNTIRGEAETDINLRAAWKPGRYTVYAEVLNVLDHGGKDINYFYTSRLPGEPLAGIDGILSRSEEPRTLRVGVKMQF